MSKNEFLKKVHLTECVWMCAKQHTYHRHLQWNTTQNLTQNWPDHTRPKHIPELSPKMENKRALFMEAKWKLARASLVHDNLIRNWYKSMETWEMSHDPVPAAVLVILWRFHQERDPPRNTRTRIVFFKLQLPLIFTTHLASAHFLPENMDVCHKKLK